MFDVIKSQKEFYMKKYDKFGDDPRSVSWNDEETQKLRFKQLIELFRHEKDGNFSVHEVGCGLAHFNSFLKANNIKCEYSGSDICEEFISECKKKYPENKFVLQDLTKELKEVKNEVKDHDYYTLSGTFNPKGENSKEDWEKFIFKIINNMFKLSKKGVVFNFITSYHDPEYSNKELYYADPKNIYDWCKKNLSRFIIVIDDLPLYEFTVIVYKEEFIKTIYPNYTKYFKNTEE